MIKVLHVLGSLRVGGLETVATNYYRYINRTKYHFTYLVYENVQDGYEEEILKLGGEIIKLPHKSNMNLVNNIKMVLREYGPFDIVHSHLYFTSGKVMKAAYDEKVLTRVAHSHTARPVSSIFKKIYYSNMKGYLKRYATDYIACSSAAGNHLFGKEFFENNGRIIKNSIDSERTNFNKDQRNIIRNQYNYKNKTVLGHVGTLNDVKNQSFLINILSKLDQRFVLMLVGEGSNKENLINEAKALNVFDRVTFIGRADNVHAYLSAMDMFLFPSLYEGLGLALIEAQAANLPCIISDRIPREAIVNESVDQLQLDERKWIKAISNFANIKINRDYVNSNIQKAGYDVKSMMKELEKVYN